MSLQCVECGNDLVVEAGWSMCSACLLWHVVTVEKVTAQPDIDDLRGNDYLSGHDSLNRAGPSRPWMGGGRPGTWKCGVVGCSGDHCATTEGVQGHYTAPAAECQRFPKPSPGRDDAQTPSNAPECSHDRMRPPGGGPPRGPGISNMHGSTDITQKIAPWPPKEPCQHVWEAAHSGGVWNDECALCGKRKPPGAVEAVKAMGIDFDAEILNEPLVEPGKDAPIPRRHRWLGDVCAECGKAAPAEGPKPVEQVPPVSRARCKHVWELKRSLGVNLGEMCGICGVRRPIEVPCTAHVWTCIWKDGAPAGRVCTICGQERRFWKET